ncbi:MAG: sugar phosphate isomerase/epimerase [Deltaproteobacteria bacterium]|nr:sugar phosphate isomerase/epimerase [Deltaproteobacteria bacterium]
MSTTADSMEKEILRSIHVNIPFTLLYDSYLPRFIQERLNPEVGIDAHALDHYSASEFRAVGETLRRNGLEVTLHCPFLDLSPGSLDPAVREVTRKRLEQTLDLLPFFEPRAVVCHAGYDERRYGFFKEKWIAFSLETWSWMAPRVRYEGSKLMLENVYEGDPRDLLDLFQALSGLDVGFCLDTGHMWAFGRKPLEEWLRVLGTHLQHLHLHDNDGGSDEHLALGRGTIEFRPLFQFLKHLKGTRPLVTLEPHREPDLSVSLEYLKQHWPWKGGA